MRFRKTLMTLAAIGLTFYCADSLQGQSGAFKNSLLLIPRLGSATVQQDSVGRQTTVTRKFVQGTVSARSTTWYITGQTTETISRVYKMQEILNLKFLLADTAGNDSTGLRIYMYQGSKYDYDNGALHLVDSTDVAGGETVARWLYTSTARPAEEYYQVGVKGLNDAPYTSAQSLVIQEMAYVQTRR